jgi:coenzyme F420-0:L-glutamate ligase/coenzyme F420-1:gamma-L-glutamate ligase
MNIAALLPVKGFRNAKQRLTPLLSSAAREVLAEAMFRDVLAQVRSARGLNGTFVVTGDDKVAVIASAAGAEVIRESGENGETGAVDFARNKLKGADCEAVLILPGDMPLVRAADIEQVLGQVPPGASAPFALLVPSHDRLGTNALLLAPPDVIKLRFGYDSFTFHTSQVSAQGLPIRFIENEHIALDLDEPKDLLGDDDVLVVAQKIVSKAEGRMVRLDAVQPSARARELGRELDKEPELVEVILGESRKVIRTGGRALIVETHHGFICANAGVDQSNVGLRQVALLPLDPDHSARNIRAEIAKRTGKKPAVIVSDSFGRAWRLGTVDVAIGVAGMEVIKDERGLDDRYGYRLKAAVAAVADELAAAAELIMGKRDGVPVVIVRGYVIEKNEEGSVRKLLRPEAEDLFR